MQGCVQMLSILDDIHFQLLRQGICEVLGVYFWIWCHDWPAWYWNGYSARAAPFGDGNPTWGGLGLGPGWVLTRLGFCNVTINLSTYNILPLSRITVWPPYNVCTPATYCLDSKVWFVTYAVLIVGAFQERRVVSLALRGKARLLNTYCGLEHLCRATESLDISEQSCGVCQFSITL